jgi:hypothetical protein
MCAYLRRRAPGWVPRPRLASCGAVAPYGCRNSRDASVVPTTSGIGSTPSGCRCQCALPRVLQRSRALLSYAAGQRAGFIGSRS